MPWKDLGEKNPQTYLYGKDQNFQEVFLTVKSEEDPHLILEFFLYKKQKLENS